MQPSNHKERIYLDPSLKKRLLWFLGGLMVLLAILSLIYAQFSASQQKFVTYENEYSNTGSSINTIDFDSQGQAWVGTYGYGLIAYDRERTVTTRTSIPGNDIYLISFDTQGRAWIYSNKGLNVLDGEDLQQFQASDLGFEYLNIRSISFDQQGKTWVGTKVGMSIFDGKSWKTYTTDNSGLVNDDIRSISFDTHGEAWIGTQNGVSSFDGKNWQTYNSENSGLVNDEIRTISVGPQGEIWIGTNNGLSIFDGEVWKNYSSSNSDLVLECIDKILFYPDQKAWVFSRQAKAGGDCIPDPSFSGDINMFDGDTWKTYTPIHWNAGNGCHSIAIDLDGFLWVGAWSGIKISKSELSSSLFDQRPQFFVSFNFLEPELIVRGLMGLGFLWIIILSIGHTSGYSIFSCALPLLSFPIWYYFGFDVDAKFFVPCTNMVVLLIGLGLAILGIRKGASKALSITAVILNLAMVGLYLFQFVFWATWH